MLSVDELLSAQCRPPHRLLGASVAAATSLRGPACQVLAETIMECGAVVEHGDPIPFLGPMARAQDEFASWFTNRPECFAVVRGMLLQRTLL